MRATQNFLGSSSWSNGKTTSRRRNGTGTRILWIRIWILPDCPLPLLLDKGYASRLWGRDSYLFSQIVNMNRVETSMPNKCMGVSYPMNPYALRTCAVGASCHVLTDLKLNIVEFSVFRYTFSWYITNYKFLVHYKGLYRNLTFGFANVLNYGIYSGLWSPFSLKTFLPDKCPRQIVEFAGTLPRIRRARKQCTKCWLPIGHKNIFCAQSETSIRMSNGTGLLRVESQGLSRQFLKPFSAVYPDPHSNFLGSEILGIG